MHRPLTLLLFSVCVLYGITEAALVAVVYPFTVSVFAMSARLPGENPGAFTSVVLDNVPFVTPENAPILLFALVSTLSYILTYTKDVLRNHVSFLVRRDCQVDIFRRWMNMDYEEFMEGKRGEFLFKIINAPGSMGVAFIQLPELFAQTVKVFAIALVLLLMSPGGMLVLAAVAAGFYLLNRRMTYRYSYRVGQTKVKCVARQNILVKESLNGLKELQVYNARDWWIREYFTATNEFAQVDRNATIMRAVPGHLLKMATVLIGTGVMLASSTSGIELTVLPLLTTYGFATYRILPYLAALGPMTGQIKESLPYIETVVSEMNESVSAVEDGTIDTVDKLDFIKLDRVSVTHRDGRSALRNVSALVRGGKTTGIVGPSGAGKSTVLNLIVRLMGPTSGNVVVGISGGQNDLSSLDLPAWRENLGMVAKDAMLFHGTIAENVGFGRPVSRDQIFRACRRAHIASFVESLPQGYDTLVGDRGLQLSGGQRQRLVIARALVGDPQILILDEATSALDYETEAAVQQEILRLAETCTLIIVAHRPSAVRFAHNILVLDKGRLVESGKHSELLAQGGHYAELFRKQETDLWAAV